MKLSDFQPMTKVIESGMVLEEYATVKVTVGMLWWKKSAIKEIVKRLYSKYWVWVETGLPVSYIDMERIRNDNATKRI